jgi:hypothetical protein
MTTASDNFNRADGALGANWSTAGVNSWVIASNRAVPNTAAAFNMMRYTGASFANDQECQIIPQPIGGFFPAACVRMGATGNCYAAMVDSASNGWRLARIDLGSNDDLATGTETFNGTTDTIKVRAVGTTISLWRNGVQLASVTDATYASGAPGLWSYESNGTVDDWSATDSLGGGSSIAAISAGYHLRGMR